MEELHNEVKDTYQRGYCERAINELVEGVQNNDFECMHNLGGIFLKEFPKEPRKINIGFQLLEKSANNYNLNANFSLGRIRYNGFFGIRRSKKEGLILIRRAALLGSGEAAWFLKKMYSSNIFQIKRGNSWGLVSSEFRHPEAEKWIRSLSSFSKSADNLAQKIAGTIYWINDKKHKGDAEAFKTLDYYSLNEF